MPSSIRLHHVLCLALLGACSHNKSTPSVAIVPPTIVTAAAIGANQNAWVPQAAVVTVATDVPTRVELRITDPDRTWDVIADPDYATHHDRVPVVGLRPDRDHSIQVLVRDQNGNATVDPTTLHFTSPPLPAWFPAVEWHGSNPQAMEPGVTLVAMMSNRPGSVPVVLDAQGQVIWYLDCSSAGLSNDQVLAFPLDNGHFMLNHGLLLVEIDMLGDIVQMYCAARRIGAIPGMIPIDVDSFHHDFMVMPEGSDSDFAVLTTEMRVLPNYPISETDPQQTAPTANVVGDEVVEFRRDGTVVRRFGLLDLLDPYRLCYDSLTFFWDNLYATSTFDWSHANAIVLDTTTNSWLVSCRHQDAVVKFSRDTGALEWILGDHERWNAPWSDHLLTPVGANFGWQYHQHAPQLLADGTVLLFDNGCGRAIPPAAQLPTADSYSRAVRFQIDPVQKTVQQVWHHGDGPQSGLPFFYSFFVSSAYKQPQTGNILICDGGKAGANGMYYGHIFEITDEPVPQKVFECYIPTSTGSPTGTFYILYRAYRIPGLYR